MRGQGELERGSAVAPFSLTGQVRRLGAQRAVLRLLTASWAQSERLNREQLAWCSSEGVILTTGRIYRPPRPKKSTANCAALLGVR